MTITLSMRRLRTVDPRWYQIASLTALLAFGLVGLDFDLRPVICAVIIVAAQGTQWACTRVWKTGPFELKSALISSLSMCLLLRTNDVAVAAAAAAIAIGSKFMVRSNGKHIFNPTNGALAALLLMGAPMWVSPGQWGSVAFVGFLLACAGTMTVTRSSRIDVVVAFLVTWSVLVVGRSVWLGEPMTIPAHRLQSGSVLLFAFFMISDPKTTPNARAGRVLFAVATAVGAWMIQFLFFRTNGLIWSLCACSLAVPLIDRVLRATPFSWTSSSPSKPLSSSSTLPSSPPEYAHVS